jgi:hypothetical protein
MPAAEVSRQVARTAEAIGVLHSTMTAVVAEAICPDEPRAGRSTGGMTGTSSDRTGRHGRSRLPGQPSPTERRSRPKQTGNPQDRCGRRRSPQPRRWWSIDVANAIHPCASSRRGRDAATPLRPSLGQARGACGQEGRLEASPAQATVECWLRVSDPVPDGCFYDPRGSRPRGRRFTRSSLRDSRDGGLQLSNTILAPALSPSEAPAWISRPASAGAMPPLIASATETIFQVTAE